MSAFSRLSESLEMIMNREDTPPPGSLLGKRPLSTNEDEDSDSEPDCHSLTNNGGDDEGSLPSISDQNLLLASRKYVARKKFKPDVIKDIEQFVNVCCLSLSSRYTTH